MAEPMPEPAPMTDLRPGLFVLISGLESAPHLNGQVAICQQYDAEKERWCVLLSNGEVKSLKPDKLKLVEQPRGPAPPPPAPGPPAPGPPAPGPPPPPPTVHNQAFQKGAVVRLHGLQAAATLNGQTAVCEQWDPKSGEWSVRLHDHTFLNVKPENLQKAEFSASQAKYFGQSSADAPPAPRPPVPFGAYGYPPPPAARPPSPWHSGQGPGVVPPPPAPGPPAPGPPMSPWGMAGGVWGSSTTTAPPPGVWGVPQPPPQHQTQHPWGGASGVFGAPPPPPPGVFGPPPAVQPPPPPNSRGPDISHQTTGPPVAVPNVMPHAAPARGPRDRSADERRQASPRSRRLPGSGFEAQAEQEIRRGLSASRSRSPPRRPRSSERRRSRGEQKPLRSRSKDRLHQSARGSQRAKRSRSREYLGSAAPVTPPKESTENPKKPVAKSTLRPVAKSSLRPETDQRRQTVAEAPIPKASIPSSRSAPSGAEKQPREPRGSTRNKAANEIAALRNYEHFHNLPSGTATLQQVISSSAGLAGWAASHSPQASSSRVPRPPQPPPRRFARESITEARPANQEAVAPPTERLEDLSADEIKARVREIYERKNPDKIRGLDGLFRKYAGSEMLVYEQVCKKYNEPLTRQRPILSTTAPTDNSEGPATTPKSGAPQPTRHGGPPASHNDGPRTNRRGVWDDDSDDAAPGPTATPSSAGARFSERGVQGEGNASADTDAGTASELQQRFARVSSSWNGVWADAEESSDDQDIVTPSAGSAHRPNTEAWGEVEDEEEPDSEIVATTAKAMARKPSAKPSASVAPKPSSARPSSRPQVSLPAPSAARPSSSHMEEDPEEEFQAPPLIPTPKMRSKIEKPQQDHKQDHKQEIEKPQQDAEDWQDEEDWPDDDNWDDEEDWQDEEDTAVQSAPRRHQEHGDSKGKSDGDGFSPLSESDDDEWGEWGQKEAQWTEEDWGAWEDEQKSSTNDSDDWMAEVDNFRAEVAEKDEEEQGDHTEEAAAPWTRKRSLSKAESTSSSPKKVFVPSTVNAKKAQDEEKGKGKGKKKTEDEEKGQSDTKASDSVSKYYEWLEGLKAKSPDQFLRAKGVAICCPGGHNLKEFKTADETACDMCEKRAGKGTMFHGCRACNYDLCTSCAGGEIKKVTIQNAKSKGKGKAKDGKAKAKAAKGKKGGKGKGKKLDWDDWTDFNQVPDKLAGDKWEEPREKVGIKLVKELAPEGLSWSYPLEDESRRSYAGFLEGALNEDQCAAFFEKIRDGTDWKRPQQKNGPMPRKTSWMVKKGCTCVYQYGTALVEPEEYPPWMYELMEATMPGCGLGEPELWPDSCNVNLYEDGGMSVGWHADDEKLFQGKFQDIKIISLSLGRTRKFELRKNWPEEGEQQHAAEIPLGNGDLLTMEGMTQKHFQHRVPREEGISDPRINLTWRWVLKHTVHCPVVRRRAHSKAPGEQESGEGHGDDKDMEEAAEAE